MPTVRVATGETIDTSRLYQVKFMVDGVVTYGIVSTYGDEADAAAAHGRLYIEDAITPKTYEIRPCDLTPVPMTHGFDPERGCCTDEMSLHIDAKLREAMATSDALPDGLHVGKLFSVGVADGQAWYVVTRVNQKSVRVEWRGFCLDRWVDQILGYGGSFPKSSIEGLCRGKFLSGAMRVRVW